MLVLNHYNDTETDICRAEFIIAACNYYLHGRPSERESVAPVNQKKLSDAYHQARGVEQELKKLHGRMFNNLREFAAENALASLEFILDALKPFSKPMKVASHRPSKEASADIHKMKGAKNPAKPHLKINEIEDEHS
jgi:hypothetical protein